MIAVGELARHWPGEEAGPGRFDAGDAAQAGRIDGLTLKEPR